MDPRDIEEEVRRQGNCLEKSRRILWLEPLWGVVGCQERTWRETYGLGLGTMNFRYWQDIQGKMSSRQSEIHYWRTSRKSVLKLFGGVFQTKAAENDYIRKWLHLEGRRLYIIKNLELLLYWESTGTRKTLFVVKWQVWGILGHVYGLRGKSLKGERTD